MKIRNVVHKGLRRFIEHDDSSGLPQPLVPKIRRIISFLQDMAREEELKTVPSWKAHQLRGNLDEVWSLFVSRNWRITFMVDKGEVEIVDLNFQDYH